MLWVDLFADLDYLQRASERSKTIFNKLLTLVQGIVMMCLAFLASKLGGLIQAVNTVSSVTAGPIAGVFILGIAAPMVTKKGAIAGFLVSNAIMFWISIGAQLYGARTPLLPLHTDFCDQPVSNFTLSSNASSAAYTATSISETPHPLWALHNISHALFGLMGVLLCLFVGLAVTYATGWQNWEDVKPEHVIHCLRHMVGPQSSTKPEKKNSYRYHFS